MVKTADQHLTIPPLENGDRLNRYEFERRYDAMLNLRKAELIEGIVYMAAALRFKSHGQPHAWMGSNEILNLVQSQSTPNFCTRNSTLCTTSRSRSLNQFNKFGIAT